MGFMNEEHKKKISESHKSRGSSHWAKKPEVRKKMSESIQLFYRNGGIHSGLGKHRSEETKKKLSEATKKQWANGQFGRGEKSHSWKGGLSTLNQIIRHSVEYKLWRIAVFIRDNRTCIWCGSKKDIQADHIKRFADYPELRFAIDNGRTLCADCHKKTSTYGKH